MSRKFPICIKEKRKIGKEALKMQLNQEEAYYVLTNLDVFVNRFERATHKKVTPGALQIIHEILTEASFPEGTMRVM